MPKKAWNGPPLDLTWQPGPWARDDDTESDNQPTDADTKTHDTPPMSTDTTDSDSSTDTANGETIAGTSPDDFGEIRTDAFPSHIDPDDLNTDLEKKIIQTAAIHTSWNQTEIAEHIGCSNSKVGSTLREYWPAHPSCHGANQADTDTNTASHSGTKPTAEDITEIREALVAGASTQPLADNYDFSRATLTRAAKGTRFQELEDDVDHPPVEYDRSTNEWSVIDDESESDGAGPESEPETTTDSTFDSDEAGGLRTTARLEGPVIQALGCLYNNDLHPDAIELDGETGEIKLAFNREG